MKLKLIPQSITGGPAPAYSAQGDILTVVYGDQTDTFDFTDMPDGQTTEIGTDILDRDGKPIQFVQSAERAGGVLTVTVLEWYLPGASVEETQEREVVI